MSKTKFKLNRTGVGELLKSPEMQSILETKTSQAVQRLGSGYGKEVKVGKKRAYSKVYADTFAAKRENAKHNTILKAVK